jgi:hypothetical protein
MSGPIASMLLFREFAKINDLGDYISRVLSGTIKVGYDLGRILDAFG